MNGKRLVGASVRTMWRYPLRTLFMGLGVAVGVAVLGVGRGLGGGAESEMRERVNRMFGPSSILISAGGAQSGGRGGPATTLTIADLEAIADRVDQVLAWDPMLTVGGRQVRYRERSRGVTLYGHSERAETVWSRGVIEGRFFTAADLATAARVALIGPRLAAVLFDEASPIGEEILINSVPLRVVGVLEPIGVDPHGMDRDEDLHLPTTTVMRRILNVDFITNAKLVVRDPERVEQTAGEIGEILRQRHSIAAGEPADFSIFTSKVVDRLVGHANRVVSLFLPIAAGVVLLVAAIVIASIMLVAVRERTGEIGLRKAVGATAGQIGLQFLLEAVAVSLTAGAIGLLLAVAGMGLVASRMALPVDVTPGGVLLGLGAAVTVGIVSGLWPARQAARLDPIAALR